ncbi:protein CROWDED NUCLEI 4-like [Cucurbita pepo subsp. pepo]|uniref:protein CROWDED NUCLEI 4-like n=1 Tax=Cucurbita pepo subsp. pepo TaxID=3664 RepID=UPI000C9D825B|nr:protein CROWDED NUCLEI 4-like [Cucurbita pepo subsp. pepo]
MASPQSGRAGYALSSGKSLSLTPGSRVLQTPLADEVIWRRLKEAGFDEESIKRRDKAALIAYIAKLEAEIFDHQHHMGLLILERKELASDYEQIKSKAETAELLYRRDQAAHLSALTEAKKREDSFKKAIGIKEECIASLEKALHEMRLESAETKVAAESRLTEARITLEDAQKKFSMAEAKLHAAESLQAEADRCNRAAERKLQEVEAREDDLRRRMTCFKSDCDKKGEEIVLERQSLSERQKALQQEHERLLDGQALLNQREEYVLSKTQELSRLEKELEDSRANIEDERRSINNEKSKLQLTEAALSKREEAVSRMEILLNKREQELLVLQEKIATKESNEIQKVVANHESTLRTKISDFDAELQVKQKAVEDEIEGRRRAWELREMDLKQREEQLLEAELDLEAQSRSLATKEKEVEELSKFLDEKEKNLRAAEQELELSKALLHKEKDECSKMKLELQQSLDYLEDRSKQVDCAKDKLEAIRSETNELSLLEMKLKEELDSVRVQKLELMDEADKLMLEKAKFEAEWEMIDEKREELRKEAEILAAERLAVSKFIKDERDSLRLERDVMRDQFNNDMETLSREREEFLDKMTCERSEWLNKMQQERKDLLMDVEAQKKELENCLEQKREELESHLREKLKNFEQEKKSELEKISFLKDKATKDLEEAALEIKKLETERMEINLDRERRNREWAELNTSIEELKVQRQKLEKQRELLHADREEILSEIERLKKFEDLKVALDNMAAAEMSQSDLTPAQPIGSPRRLLKQRALVRDADLNSQHQTDTQKITNGFGTPSMPKLDGDSHPTSTPFSWIKRCSELIFKQSAERERASTRYRDKNLISQADKSSSIPGQLLQSREFEMDGGNGKSQMSYSERPDLKYAIGEPKVIVEVPPVGKDMKGVPVLESEIVNDVTVSDRRILAGRKRRATNITHPGSLGHMEVEHNNKKRRQQEISVNPAEEDPSCPEGASSQMNVLENPKAFGSSTENQESVKEAEVVIVNTDINIIEVMAYKPKNSDIPIDQDASNHQQTISEKY